MRIKKEVKNNEIIRIHTEWLPFNSSSLYENKKEKIRRKIKKLRKNYRVSNAISRKLEK